MSIPVTNLLLLYAAVFFAGLVDSIAGGGGLLSLPAYLAVGMPPHLAAGTNKLSATIGTAVATSRFLKSGRFSRKAALFSVPAALLGSYLGASLALYVDSKYFKYILICVLPIIALFVLTQKTFGEQDLTEKLTDKRVFILSALSGLLIGVYDGFIGPGTGTFLILIHTGLIGFGLATASGNAKVINLSTNAAALLTFLLNSQVNIGVGVGAALFGVAGNWIGSGLAVKKGAKVIRPFFIVVVIILFAKIFIDITGAF